MADLTTTADKHGVSLHAFADDTVVPMYLHCCHDDTASAATQLEQCVADVGRWMSRNHFNTDKTELLWVRPRHSLHQHDLCLPELHLGHDSVVARDHVRLLGSTILSDLTFIDTSPSSVSQASTGFGNCGITSVQ